MPKIVDREEMQAGILDAAMRVYSKKGYHAATIADVAVAAGLGKGTLYLYFKNKEALAIAMVDRHLEGMERRFVSDELSDTLDDFGKNLARAMDVPDEHAAFVRVFFEVFGPSFASDAFTKHVAAFFDRLGDHYAKQFVHLQDAGQVSRGFDAKSLGRVLASLVDGVVLHRGLFGISKKRQQKMIQSALKMFNNGLSGPLQSKA